ncbi:hypothetical protein J132_04561 [Termitomyces sp. J132]|nr:hypothetical protein J132_04561 [Termitomyces sp. J132]
MPIFYDDITFILQPEIPHNVLSFIDDIGAKGPKDWKIVNGKPAKHPANPNVCLALWEFFELLNRVLQQMKYCSGIFSGYKLVLCAPTFKILGHVCMPSVDTSYIAVSYYLCQYTSSNCKECPYNHFGLIMLNNREAKFSQPKLELYGLYQALQALQMYLIGIRNLIIEVDTHYIKSMLQNSNIQPSASMNHWIMAILMFHFELVHIKGTFHGPDSLLQCLLQPSNPPPDNSNNPIYEDQIDCLHEFIHQPLVTFVSNNSNALQLANSNNIQPLCDDGTTAYSNVLHSAKAIASDCQVLLTTDATPSCLLSFSTHVIKSKEQVLAYTENVFQTMQAIVYCDGSGYKDNIGVAAVLYMDRRESDMLKYHLGPTMQHIVYKAEIISILPGLHLLANLANRLPAQLALGRDSQAMIKALLNQ